MPRTILVENTEDRIHCIADLALRVDPVLTASPGSPAPPKDALLPGANEVDAEEWAKAEKIPLVQFYLKQGILKARKDSVADLPKLKPEEAVELVRSEERRVGKECRSRWTAY